MATEPTEKHGKIIQAKQPNYNYHHEEREGHEGLQIVQQPGYRMWDVEAANNHDTNNYDTIKPRY